jgi:hypothetical protein
LQSVLEFESPERAMVRDNLLGSVFVGSFAHHWALTAVALVTFSACLAEFAVIDDLGAGGSTSATGGGGAAGGMGGSGGSGGTGGVLVDRGLVARYYLDEAASGKDPTHAVDANRVVDLEHGWGGAGGEAWPVAYDEVAGQRGLRWTAVGAMGGPSSTPLGMTAVPQALMSTTTGTLELVADIEATSDMPPSHLFGLSRKEAGVGVFNLIAPDALTWRFGWDEMPGGFWAPPTGRVVVHLVVDTDLATNNRRKLFVDGVLAEESNGSAPADGASLSGFMGVQITIGNRADGGRSAQGIIYYAALYQSALTVGEVENNAAVLIVDDDQPQ